MIEKKFKLSVLLLLAGYHDHRQQLVGLRLWIPVLASRIRLWGPGHRPHSGICQKILARKYNAQRHWWESEFVLKSATYKKWKFCYFVLLNSGDFPVDIFMGNSFYLPFFLFEMAAMPFPWNSNLLCLWEYTYRFVNVFQ